MNLLVTLGFFQYYEMSYGLNVEMHKQVRRLQKYEFNWSEEEKNAIYEDSLCKRCLHFREIFPD